MYYDDSSRYTVKHVSKFTIFSQFRLQTTSGACKMEFTFQPNLHYGDGITSNAFMVQNFLSGEVEKFSMRYVFFRYWKKPFLQVQNVL